MKFFFLFIYCFFASILFSQYAPEITHSNQVLSIKDTKLIVITYGNEAYDEQVKTAVQNYWKHTKFDFISIDDLSNYIKQDRFSFLMITDLKVAGEKERVKAMALTRGGFLDDEFYINHVLAYVAIDNIGFEPDFEDFSYRVPHMVSQISYMIDWLSKQEIEMTTQEKMRTTLEEHYASKSHLLEKKQLMIDVRYTLGKIVSTEEFKELYPYRLLFVEPEEIQKAIEERDEDKAYLISAANVYKYNMVVNCANGRLIYVNRKEKDPVYGELDATFNDEDIALLVNTIKESIKQRDKAQKKKEKKSN